MDVASIPVPNSGAKRAKFVRKSHLYLTVITHMSCFKILMQESFLGEQHFSPYYEGTNSNVLTKISLFLSGSTSTLFVMLNNFLRPKEARSQFKFGVKILECAIQAAISK